MRVGNEEEAAGIVVFNGSIATTWDRGSELRLE
jgi:hypothetical protein